MPPCCRPVHPFLILLFAACLVSGGENPLRNNSFADWPEGALLPRHWGAWAHDVTAGELTRDQDAVRFVDGAQRHQLFQGVPITGGETYQVSCLKKVQLASFFMILAIQWRDAEGKSIEYSMTLDGGYDTDFLPLSLTATAPLAATTAVVIVGPYCIHRDGAVAKGHIWVRDVTLAPADPEAAAATGPPPVSAGEYVRSRLENRPAAPFVVRAATESDKFYPDTHYDGSLDAPLHLELAGNEYGSFQLAVISLGDELADATVAVAGLAPAECTWFRIDFVHLEPPRPWSGLHYEHPMEPDPLLPAAPFTVPAGALVPIWVDMKLPAGTPAGVYTGTVSVTAGGHTVSRPVEIECHGFDIPTTNSLASEFWWTPSNWRAFYQYQLRYTPELHAQHAAVLARYRIGAFPCDWITLCPQVPVYREADGHFTFDWSTFDRYVENARANGATAYWSALSCNSGWTRYLHNPDVAIIDRATGERHTLGEYLPPLPESKGWIPLADLPYRENPVYRDFLVAYVAHLKELGINDQAYYELFDEPSGDRFLAMLDHHRYFRELVPDLQLFDFGVDPTREVDGQTAVGLIDTWGPHLDRLANPNVLAALHQRRRDHGEKFWFYTCVEKRQNPDGTISHANRWTPDRWSPFCVYHRPYIALRIQPWMAWKYDADGFYVFMLNAVPKPNEGRPEAERWPATPWTEGTQQGSGTLVYPGPDFSLVPGMRLANLRDGIEDYEYLALLRRLASGAPAALRPRVEAALALPPQIVDSPFDWTRDRAVLIARRRQIAELIRLLTPATGAAQ